MVIYNLDETPDNFIGFRFYDDIFDYVTGQFGADDNWKRVDVMDLKSDKLFIYGTEITESALQRLYDSLCLRSKRGVMYVNCNGACYIFITSEKRTSRLIHNVLGEKDKAMETSNQLLSESRIEVESLKSNLRGSSDEVEKLKEKLSSGKKIGNAMEIELQKAYEKFTLVDFERERHKVELESYKKDVDELVDELIDELCTSKKERHNLEVELQKLKSYLLNSNSELVSTKVELEISNNRRNELEHRVSSLSNKNDEMETKVTMLEKQCSLASSELQSFKDQLDSSSENAKELEVQLSNTRNGSRALERELQNVQQQLLSSNSNLQSTKVELEISTKRLDEEVHQVSSLTKARQELEHKFKMLENELSMTCSEHDSTKDQLESSIKKVEDLDEQLLSCIKEDGVKEEELQKVYDQLRTANHELEIAKAKQQHLEEQLQRVLEHLDFIKFEAEFSNQTLDQVLLSNLWSKVDKNLNLVSMPLGSLHDLNSSLSFAEFECSSSSTLEINHEVQIL